MIIQYYKETQYGTTRMYIKDKIISGLIESLTGKKTISEKDISVLTDLTGCAWVEVIK